jgi:hypothetical protein
MARNTLSRTLHDVGLAAWFGGSLMGAVGLNAAAGAVDDPAQRGRVVNEGWDRWTPLNAGAIGAHLLGGAAILLANRKRVAGQQGVAGMTAIKTVRPWASPRTAGSSAARSPPARTCRSRRAPSPSRRRRTTWRRPSSS